MGLNCRAMLSLFTALSSTSGPSVRSARTRGVRSKHYDDADGTASTTYNERIAVAASTTVSRNLEAAGNLTDGLGGAVAMVHVWAWQVHNRGEVPIQVRTATGVMVSNATTDYLNLPAGGTLAGIYTTGETAPVASIFEFKNPSADTAGSVDFIVIGESGL